MIVDGCKECGQSKSAAYERDNARFELKQFKAWAEPQIIQHGADTLLIAQMREVLKDVGSMDCCYTGGHCKPDCQCLSARAERLAATQEGQPK